MRDAVVFCLVGILAGASLSAGTAIQQAKPLAAGKDKKPADNKDNKPAIEQLRLEYEGGSIVGSRKLCYVVNESKSRAISATIRVKGKVWIGGKLVAQQMDLVIQLEPGQRKFVHDKEYFSEHDGLQTWDITIVGAKFT